MNLFREYIPKFIFCAVVILFAALVFKKLIPPTINVRIISERGSRAIPIEVMGETQIVGSVKSDVSGSIIISAADPFEIKNHNGDPLEVKIDGQYN